MNALVVYDSQYGNTQRVAEAIAHAISDVLGIAQDVKLLRAGEVTPEHLAGPRLLVVGSPTQRFRPTPAMTRFLASVAAGGLEGVHVAAFDTRLDVPEVKSRVLSFFVWLFGPGAYAAKHLADGLEQRGGKLIAPPEGFFVQGTAGPLRDGELSRAASWAGALADKVAVSQLAMT